MDWTYAAAPRRQRRADRAAEAHRPRGSRDATIALGFGPTARRGAEQPRAPRSTAGFARVDRALPGRLAPLPRRAAPPAQRRRPRAPLRRLADGARRLTRTRPTAAPGIASPRCLGLGDAGLAGRSPTTSSGRATSTRSPPRRSRPATGPGRTARSTTCRPPAEARRLLPAELRRRRHAALDEPAARRGRRPDRPRLAARPHRRRAPGTHVEAAASCILANGPVTRRSAGRTRPATRRRRSRAEIAGLVCAARDRAGATATRAERRRYAADRRRLAAAGRRLDASRRTARSRRKPYYLRLTKDGNPNAGTTYTSATAARRSTSAGSSTRASSSSSGSASSRPTTAIVRSTLPVVDRELGVDTPSGRSSGTATSYDGYGETPTGGTVPEPGETSAAPGRCSPASAASTSSPPASFGDTRPPTRAARARLDAIAATANDGLMLPEQVWDHDRARRAPGPGAGHGFSATPLAWTHAQFVRLAWSIDAGRRSSARPRRLPLRRPLLTAASSGAP